MSATEDRLRSVVSRRMFLRRGMAAGLAVAAAAATGVATTNGVEARRTRRDTFSAASTDSSGGSQTGGNAGPGEPSVGSPGVGTPAGGDVVGTPQTGAPAVGTTVTGPSVTCVTHGGSVTVGPGNVVTVVPPSRVCTFT